MRGAVVALVLLAMAAVDAGGGLHIKGVPQTPQCLARVDKMDINFREIREKRGVDDAGLRFLDGIFQHASLMVGSAKGSKGVLLHFCCTMPENLACWGDLQEQQGGGILVWHHLGGTHDYVICCWADFLAPTVQAPEWMRDEVREQLASIANDRAAFRPEAFSRLEREWGFRFCRIRVLDGEITGCDWDSLKSYWAQQGEGKVHNKKVRALQILRAVNLVHAHQTLPDGLDLLVSLGDFEVADWPAPVLATSTGFHNKRVVLIPPLELLGTDRMNLVMRIHQESLRRLWRRKKNKVFFRGALSDTWLTGTSDDDEPRFTRNTSAPLHCARGPGRRQASLCADGAAHKSTDNWARFSRGRLVQLSLQAPAAIDAKFSRCAWTPPSAEGGVWRCNGGCVIDWSAHRELCAAMEASNATTSGERITPEDQVGYRYLVVPDGAGYPGRLYWAAFANSLLVVPATALRSWLKPPSRLFRPFEHFLPVRGDFSDLLDRWRWAEANSNVAEKMAQRAQDAAWEAFTTGAVLQYWRELLVAYGEVQKRLRGA